MPLEWEWVVGLNRKGPSSETDLVNCDRQGRGRSVTKFCQVGSAVLDAAGRPADVHRLREDAAEGALQVESIVRDA